MAGIDVNAQAVVLLTKELALLADKLLNAEDEMEVLHSKLLKNEAKEQERVARHHKAVTCLQKKVLAEAEIKRQLQRKLDDKAAPLAAELHQHEALWAVERDRLGAQVHSLEAQKNSMLAELASSGEQLTQFEMSILEMNQGLQEKEAQWKVTADRRKVQVADAVAAQRSSDSRVVVLEAELKRRRDESKAAQEKMALPPAFADTQTQTNCTPPARPKEIRRHELEQWTHLMQQLMLACSEAAVAVERIVENTQTLSPVQVHSAAPSEAVMTADANVGTESQAVCHVAVETEAVPCVSSADALCQTEPVWAAARADVMVQTVGVTRYHVDAQTDPVTRDKLVHAGMQTYSHTPATRACNDAETTASAQRPANSLTPAANVAQTQMQRGAEQDTARTRPANEVPLAAIIKNDGESRDERWWRRSPLKATDVSLTPDSPLTPLLPPSETRVVQLKLHVSTLDTVNGGGEGMWPVSPNPMGTGTPHPQPGFRRHFAGTLPSMRAMPIIAAPWQSQDISRSQDLSAEQLQGPCTKTSELAGALPGIDNPPGVVDAALKRPLFRASEGPLQVRVPASPGTSSSVVHDVKCATIGILFNQIAADEAAPRNDGNVASGVMHVADGISTKHDESATADPSQHHMSPPHMSRQHTLQQQRRHDITGRVQDDNGASQGEASASAKSLSENLATQTGPNCQSTGRDPVTHAPGGAAGSTNGAQDNASEQRRAHTATATHCNTLQHTCSTSERNHADTSSSAAAHVERAAAIAAHSSGMHDIDAAARDDEAGVAHDVSSCHNVGDSVSSVGGGVWLIPQKALQNGEALGAACRVMTEIKMTTSHAVAGSEMNLQRPFNDDVAGSETNSQCLLNGAGVKNEQARTQKSITAMHSIESALLAGRTDKIASTQLDLEYACRTASNHVAANAAAHENVIHDAAQTPASLENFASAPMPTPHALVESVGETPVSLPSVDARVESTFVGSTEGAGSHTQQEGTDTHEELATQTLDLSDESLGIASSLRNASHHMLNTHSPPGARVQYPIRLIDDEGPRTLTLSTGNEVEGCKSARRASSSSPRKKPQRWEFAHPSTSGAGKTGVEESQDVHGPPKSGAEAKWLFGSPRDAVSLLDPSPHKFVVRPPAGRSVALAAAQFQTQADFKPGLRADGADGAAGMVVHGLGDGVNRPDSDSDSDDETWNGFVARGVRPRLDASLLQEAAGLSKTLFDVLAHNVVSSPAGNPAAIERSAHPASLVGPWGAEWQAAETQQREPWVASSAGGTLRSYEPLDDLLEEVRRATDRCERRKRMIQLLDKNGAAAPAWNSALDAPPEEHLTLRRRLKEAPSAHSARTSAWTRSSARGAKETREWRHDGHSDARTHSRRNGLLNHRFGGDSPSQSQWATLPAAVSSANGAVTPDNFVEGNSTRPRPLGLLSGSGGLRLHPHSPGSPDNKEVRLKTMMSADDSVLRWSPIKPSQMAVLRSFLTKLDSDPS